MANSDSEGCRSAEVHSGRTWRLVLPVRVRDGYRGVVHRNHGARHGHSDHNEGLPQNQKRARPTPRPYEDLRCKDAGQNKQIQEQVQRDAEDAQKAAARSSQASVIRTQTQGSGLR